MLYNYDYGDPKLPQQDIYHSFQAKCKKRYWGLKMQMEITQIIKANWIQHAYTSYDLVNSCNEKYYSLILELLHQLFEQLQEIRHSKNQDSDEDFHKIINSVIGSCQKG